MSSIFRSMFANAAMMSGGGHAGVGSTINALVSQLQSGECVEPFMTMEILSEICEKLSLVQNAESELSGLRMMDLCRVLSGLLPNVHDSPDSMLLAARAMVSARRCMMARCACGP